MISAEKIFEMNKATLIKGINMKLKGQKCHTQPLKSY